MSDKSLVTSALFGIAFIVLGFYANSHYHRPTISEMNNGHSAAFRGNGTEDTLVPIALEDAYRYEEGVGHFGVEVPWDAVGVETEFYYQCQPECEQVWMDVFLGSEEDNPTKSTYLLEHPIFKNLNWFYVDDNSLSIYQKRVKYRSADKLMSQERLEKILLDPQLLLPQSPETATAHTLGDYLEVGEHEYIITSFTPLHYVGNWRKIMRPFHLSEIKRDGTQILEIKVYSLGSSDQKRPVIYIGKPEFNIRK